MPRSSRPIHSGYPEPERQLRALRRKRKTRSRPEEQEVDNVAERNEPIPLVEEATMVDNDIIGIANDRARSIRDYAVFDPATMSNGIVLPEITAAQFEFKPMMFQMLQTTGQYAGSPNEDPHLHLRQFLDVASNFKIPGVTDDAFRLRLFPYSLRDRAKSWLNSLEPRSITTWNDLAEKFLAKYFPPSKNAKMRNEITSFRQGDDESLFDAWERFKELLRQCPHHGILICIQLETFYNGLIPSSRNMLDASSG